MIKIRKACIDDVESIREVFQAEYGDDYAYPQYYDIEELRRLVYADDSVLLVAVDDDSNEVLGTASVVFSVGAHNDLIGEFGRLVVHPKSRGQGIGKRLMQSRIEHVESRLHVGIVENRASHPFSQMISHRFGFVPVGFAPMKLMISRRELTAYFVRYFANALALRRNNPRIIPEASRLAGLALENCGLPCDVVVDDSSAPYPYDNDFEIDDLRTAGYASLLRIERGRIRHRDVFGPVRLHYGLFQLRARHSHYLIARRNGQVAGGIGFMVDEAEKAVRVFELISLSDEPIRFLLDELVQVSQQELGMEYIEVDVSAYSPRMQRTLMELGFLPIGYIPANVFHEVERLDAIKMARLLVPLDIGEVSVTAEMQPIADLVIKSFEQEMVQPQISDAFRRTPLFVGLNEEQCKRLASVCEYQVFEPAEQIFREGQPAAEMRLILNGCVQLSTKDKQIAEVSTGQCLGESSLLYATPVALPHTVSAVAKTRVETATYSRDAFSELARRRPDIGVVIYRNLAADISTKLKSTTH